MALEVLLASRPSFRSMNAAKSFSSESKTRWMLLKLDDLEKIEKKGRQLAFLPT